MEPENDFSWKVKAESALKKAQKLEAKKLSEGARWVKIDERTEVLRKTKRSGEKDHTKGK